MGKLVVISGKEMCKVLEKAGFVKIHQHGSHEIFEHADGRKTVVPVHDNRGLHIGTLEAILKQAGISREEYDELR